MRSLRRLLIGALAAGLIAGTMPRAAAQGRAAELTAEQVQNAIRQGTQYLLNQQNARGQWDEMVIYPGGVTALVTLALLNAGVEPSHPKLQKSLDYLRGLKPDKTYTVSLQTMALCAAEPARYLPQIQENARWLERVQIKQGDRAGSWSYGAEMMGGDNSNSQFAVLALHEAELAGARIDPQTWRRAADYWKRAQEPNGSWSYTLGGGLPSTGSMTAAGIGAWVICSGHVAAASADAAGGIVQCCLPAADD
ncbi:MAG TPA: hypothetical protein PJ982_12715, partial [Lacipirellulaceae bacterium]|nr:hypothetical protein [Lacipirellulaceae bacterium]